MPNRPITRSMTNLMEEHGGSSEGSHEESENPSFNMSRHFVKLEQSMQNMSNLLTETMTQCFEKIIERLDDQSLKSQGHFSKQNEIFETLTNFIKKSMGDNSQPSGVNGNEASRTQNSIEKALESGINVAEKGESSHQGLRPVSSHIPIPQVVNSFEDERPYVPPPLRSGQLDRSNIEISQSGMRRPNFGPEFGAKVYGKQPMFTNMPGGQNVRGNQGLNVPADDDFRPRPSNVNDFTNQMLGGQSGRTFHSSTGARPFEVFQNPTFNSERPLPFENVNRGNTPDRNEIVNIVQECMAAGNQRRIVRPLYRKPYPEYIDQYNDFPRGYKVPEFTLFSGDGGQSTIEHIGRFTIQCGEISANENLKLRLFGNSLTGTAFTWYISLPPNSVMSWRQMEERFHMQFYRSEPEITMADLSKFRQLQGESAEQYIARFKKARNRCNVFLPEHEFVKLAQNGLELELRKKFEGMDFEDLFELSTRASRYERLLREEDQRKASSYGTYYHDPNFEVDLAEVIARKPFICQALKKKDVEAPSDSKVRKNLMDTKRKFSFDISKASEIFDHLLTGKFIRLLDGHKLPGRETGDFCKWHATRSHDTNSCVIFRHVIQDCIDKGLLRFPEKDKETMAVDSDPFPVAEIAVASTDLRSLSRNQMQNQYQSGFPHSQQQWFRNERSWGFRRPRVPFIPNHARPQMCCNCSHSMTLESRPRSFIRPYHIERTQRYPNFPHIQKQWVPKHQVPKAQGVGNQNLRMVRPPLTQEGVWTRLEHPKFPNPFTRTQKRRFQRRRAEYRRSSQTTSSSGTNEVRKSLTISVEGDHRRVREVLKDDKTGAKTFTKEGRGIIATLEEIEDRSFGLKANKGQSISSDETVKQHGDQEDLMAEDEENDNSDEDNFLLQFGSLPPVMGCNMAFTLPLIFQAKEGEEPIVIEREEDRPKGTSVVIEEVEKINEEGDIEKSENIVFEKPPEKMTQHLRPLFINVHMDGRPMQRVLVDNGAAVNILPSASLKKLGKMESDLIPTEVTVANFSGGVTKTKGVLPVTLTVGNRECLSAFFVVDSTASYNALLGRDWIHSNWCVPSSLHQFLILWNGSKVEVVWADQRPFIAGSNVAEAHLYGGDVGPIKFIGTDKEGRPREMTTAVDLFSRKAVERVIQETTRPGAILLDQPLSSCSIEEVP